MNLTQQEKEDLRQLTKHAWYKVLEKVESFFKYEYLDAYREVDFWNEKAIELLKQAQIYIRAREWFFRDTAKHIQEAQAFNVSDYFKKNWQT